MACRPLHRPRADPLARPRPGSSTGIVVSSPNSFGRCLRRALKRVKFERLDWADLNAELRHKREIYRSFNPEMV